MRQPFSYYLVGFSAIVLIIAAGCRDDRGDARAVARTFLEATESHDNTTAQSVVTRKAQPLFDGDSRPMGEHDGNESFAVEEPVIKGDIATVPVRLTDDKGTQETILQMRREEGKWRIYAMQMPTYPGGPSVTMDFENPMAVIPDALHAAGVVLGQVTKGMEQGTKEFAHGFDQGYGKPLITGTPTPGAVVEEVH
jgi:hypothetical protein